MESELNILEGRIAALVAEYERACERNRALHAQVTALQADNKRLNDKLVLVAERVEGILARMPEEQS